MRLPNLIISLAYLNTVAPRPPVNSRKFPPSIPAKWPPSTREASFTNTPKRGTPPSKSSVLSKFPAMALRYPNSQTSAPCRTPSKTPPRPPAMAATKLAEPPANAHPSQRHGSWAMTLSLPFLNKLKAISRTVPETVLAWRVLVPKTSVPRAAALQLLALDKWQRPLPAHPAARLEKAPLVPSTSPGWLLPRLYVGLSSWFPLCSVQLFCEVWQEMCEECKSIDL